MTLSDNLIGLGNLPSLDSRQIVLFDMPRRVARADTRRFEPDFKGSWVVGDEAVWVFFMVSITVLFGVR